ncbi:MAG: PAS domain S-box protein [Acidobacteria bacterium]|nr:PAS domain S-box protein [Acidobacteriota bacterium]
MKASVGKKVAIGYLIAIPILLIVGLMQAQVLQNFTRVQQEAARAVETLEEIEAVLTALGVTAAATEGGLSGKGADATRSREEARASTRTRLQGLRELAAKNPRQAERLSALETLAEKHFQSLQEPAAPGAARKPGAVSAKTLETSGDTLAGEIRKLTDEMKVEELAVMRERSTLGRALADKASYITTFWGLLALWLIALAALLMYRKSSEQKWVGIERRMKARILESMPVGVCLTDDSGIILYSNPAEAALLGYEEDELLGRYLAHLESRPAEERERLFEEINGVLRAQGVWQREFLAVRKDRSTFRCATRAVAMETSEKAYRVFVQEDVSDDRVTEQE